jgi:hypothetical protein
MRKASISSVFLLIISLASTAQETEKTAQSIIQNASISGEWFLGYNYNDKTDISSFNLKRGYFTIKTRLNDVISARYTQDITNDSEGGDMGNVEMRLKYLYLMLELKNIEALKNTYFEFGMVHRPWLDFEQKLNGYRVQGKMFVDRYDLTSSAGFGITYAGLLGGEIDKDYQNRVSKDYPGRLGSFSIGLYNGGGYHAFERNNNKIVEGRLSLRPLPESLPGLQLSYSLSYGKANTELNESDYRLNLFYLSTQSEYHKLLATYYRGEGSYGDDYIDDSGISYKNDGYSLFAEIFIPGSAISVFSRYDTFTSHQDVDEIQETIIAGLTYRFLKNKVLFNFDQNKANGAITNIYELALEINF